MMTVTYPRGYGYQVGTLDQTMAEVVAHGHPVFVLSLRFWLIDQGGWVGIGDAWRATGTQPSLPGFAPEGKSFHQDQRFRSGFIGSCAVDLVVRRDGSAHRAPFWKEVIKSGSADSKRYGLHCNIDTESWHMQPYNIFGWQSWVDNGRPDPLGGAGSTPPPPPPPDGLIKSAPPSTPFPLRRTDLDPAVLKDPTRTRWLQQIMNERFGSVLKIDGGFGQATHDAVLVMQRILDAQPNVQVGADGVYGQQTAAALAAWLAVH